MPGPTQVTQGTTPVLSTLAQAMPARRDGGDAGVAVNVNEVLPTDGPIAGGTNVLVTGADSYRASRPPAAARSARSPP